MSSQSIANRLESARLALTNALGENELLSALAPFGYDETRLQQGQSLYENALTVWHSQQQKQSRRRAATAAYHQAATAASRAYMRGVRLCRTLYRDDAVTYHALGLAGNRKKGFAAKVAQMRLFYTTALGTPAILSTLTGYGFNESQLQADLALVAALESARSQREVESGTVQDATQSKEQAITALERWMREFVTIAHLALEENTQRLEMLGLVGG
ncbi:MAG: hypothetical protein KJZ86_08040 [Caldilineaceae bacterium]|nr:hypothetical protein [Caldilineaceae bacterium]HRJ41303.1 hypothetical protein [Caldilineaceae bacterium]